LNENIKEWFLNNVLQIISFAIYALFTINFLFRLNELNKTLPKNNYLKIVTNPEAQSFFLQTVILVILGVGLIIFFFYNLGDTDISGRLTRIIFSVVVLFLLIAIIVEIQNPILRAFFTIFVIGGGAFAVYND